MAQNPQQPNYSYYQNQNQYYQNQYSYYSQYNNPYSTTISPPGTLNQLNTTAPPPPGTTTPLNTTTPPPPGVSNFSSQPSPPGTAQTLTQQNYPLQYYNPYSYPYYYQQQPQQTQQYPNNLYPSSQPVPPSTYTAQPPPPTSVQPPPPPGYPPQINSSISTPINNNTINNNVNSFNKEQENKNSYNQIKFNVNSANKKTENTFKPEFIVVRPPSNKNVLENKKKEEEMKAKEKQQEKKGVEYPESLKEYITRMYKECPKDKYDVLSAELKKLIFDAQQRNALNTIKWENMGLPMACRETSKPAENPILLSNLLNNTINNKKRKRFMDVSSSSSPYSSQLSSSTIEMDESLMKLPEKERMEEIKRRERRAKRFNDDYNAEMKKRHEKEALHRQAEITKQKYIEQNGNPDVVDWDQDTLVGTCQDLEKSYLRLTSAPDPATVRPLSVLRKTLELLKNKWRTEQNYNYICDQFKSLRQDLTVQRIKNDFAVEVYEIHARIALEKGDLGEYNQCQSQLKQLYNLGFNGHIMEFTAYRLLYYLHTLNPKDINTLISELTPEQKNHEFIKHALEVRSAVANGNYHKLFYLYINPPKNMACYLMDQFVERERIKALKIMTKAYLTLSIEFITKELGFDSEEDCIDLLKSVRCPIKKEKNKEYISGKVANPIFTRKWQEITKKGIDIKGQI